MIRDLIALKTFATIATLGSFARAADKLGISRGMASKHIADLEAELGVKLLNRTTRQLSLTEAGQTLNATATTLFGLLDTAEQDIRASTASPRGTLRVNAPMSFGVLHLGRIVSDFLRQCPDVEVELTLDDRVVNVVEEGYDIAIRIRRLEDSSLIAKHLAPARMVTCASPAYLERRGEPRHPHDLEHHDCLVYDYLSRQGTWSFERNGVREDVRVDGRLWGNNGEVLMQAALDGHGITLSPTFIAHEALRAGTLKPVLCDWSVVEPAFFAVMPPGRNNVLKVRAFLDHLAKSLGRDPYWDRDLPLERFKASSTAA
jgi:DNA-binding transcriptional LysR family regulator